MQEKRRETLSAFLYPTFQLFSIFVIANETFCSVSVEKKVAKAEEKAERNAEVSSNQPNRNSRQRARRKLYFLFSLVYCLAGGSGVFLCLPYFRCHGGF